MSNVKTHTDRFTQWVNGIEKDADLTPEQKAEILDKFKEILSGPILKWMAAAEEYRLGKTSRPPRTPSRHARLQLPAGTPQPRIAKEVVTLQPDVEEQA
jgi:hypothetical protein